MEIMPNQTYPSNIGEIHHYYHYCPPVYKPSGVYQPTTATWLNGIPSEKENTWCRVGR